MGKHYSQLTMDERNDIHRCSNEGLSLRAIARRLNRPTSTVTREVARNTVGKSYDAARADRAALARRRRGTVKLKAGAPLLNRVCALMAMGWSPEQVAGRLRRMNPDEPACHVSHETIYCAIYALPRGELRSELIAQLRFAHKARMPRTRGQDRRGQLPNMTSIHLRPIEVAARLIPGHWEGDLIKGAGNKSAVGVLVERATRLVLLCKMPDASAQRSGAGNLDSLLGGNSGHNAGPKGAGHRSFDGQEISAAHPPHPHAGFQGAGRLGGLARRQDVGRSGQAV